MKVAVLGAGRVGRTIARDLARDSEFEVTVMDRAPIDPEAFKGAPGISTLRVDLGEAGALEAFITDGLRTLLQTCETPEMVGKTVRYPGHAEWMKGLRHVGFFEKTPMQIGEGSVSPMEVTARLLERVWTFREGEEDLTEMRVKVDGVQGGKQQRRTFFLLDRFDTATGTSSMARTTGFTCTAMVRLVARKLYTEPGITPLELVGRDPACFDFVMKELEDRGVVFRREVEDLQG